MVKEIIEDGKDRMQKSVIALDSSFAKIRAGRAHPSLLEHIQVEYYGAITPLAQVANINVEDARTLKVLPWEKDMVSVVEKAIITSDLGLNPNTQGQVIRIPLPPLTAERRADLVKVVREEAENSRVSVRNIRRDCNNDIKDLLKEKEISEDEAKQAENNIQKITDQFIMQIEQKLKEKEVSLTEI